MRNSVTLRYTPSAAAELDRLSKDPSSAVVWRAMRKTLALMETNLRRPGLRTHRLQSLSGPAGEAVFEAYAQNKTPAAFRVFWHYGPDKSQLTILAVTSHP